jgi:putative flippase GtrA
VALPGLLLLLAPADHRHGVTTAASLMGMSLGFALERHWVRFDSGGALRKRALRFMAGMALLMLLVWAFETLSSGVEPSVFLRFLRYMFLGLAATAGVPWLFLRLGLAEKRHSDS